MLPQKITVSQDVGVSIPGFGLSKQHFDASVQRNPVFSAIQWAGFLLNRIWNGILRFLYP